MSEASAIFPPKDSGLGLQSLAREMEAMAQATFRPPPFPAEELPRGEGRSVLVLPGFMAGDWTTARLREFLGQLDYQVATPEILFNAGPTRGILAKLDSVLGRLFAASQEPIALVGISLGGTFARYLARANAQRVRRVVTLCSPIRFPVTTPLQPFAQALAAFHESQWLAERAAIAGDIGVPVTAIYSETDGIVDWRQCLQDERPGCENVSVQSAHTTIGSHPDAQRVVARALA